MPVLRLKLADLQTLSDPSAEGAQADAGSADLETRLRRQFAFLPDPITVTVDGEKVIVEFPEETAGSRAEAARLAEKAGKRASEGNYGKAIDIYQRVLELQPSRTRIKEEERADIVAAASEAWEAAHFASSEGDVEVWKELFGPRFKIEDN